MIPWLGYSPVWTVRAERVVPQGLIGVQQHGPTGIYHHGQHYFLLHQPAAAVIVDEERKVNVESRVVFLCVSLMSLPEWVFTCLLFSCVRA